MAVAGLLALAVFGCSSNSTASSEETISEKSTTTVAQEKGDCSNDSIEAAVGEPASFRCFGVWASLMPDSYAKECTECESVLLYKWESGKWNLKGNCHQYNILEDGPCSGLSGRIQNPEMVEFSDFPDKKTACEIWDANTWLRNIARTGCTPSKDSVQYDRTEPCDTYYDYSALPIGRCEKGRAVRSIQKHLIAGGAKIDLDGYFGTGTVVAVMDFQTAHGLPMSGYVDETTWKTLIPNQAELPGADSNGDGLVTPDEFK